jgi:murein DD-endopeptidase MepM/ murein hydrolase activator NlpD
MDRVAAPAPRSRAGLIAALLLAFYAGAIVDWWVREKAAGVRPVVTTVDSTAPAAPPASPSAPAGSAPAGPPASAAPAPAATLPLLDPGEAVVELRGRSLQVPVDGVDPEHFKGGFAERRDGGDRGHEAVDILAPRNTPIHAVEDGIIAKLFFSKAGGITIYQFDPTRRFCYYYAHLERYADNLKEGQQIARGDVIGYVGTTGNAPPGTPHLHFAVLQLAPGERWWQGQPLDPYLVFRRDGE